MLDSTSYLSSFGWQGKGTGLRQGGVSRPLAIPQKRTLAGLGKDRDEAFPFWDHLFAAAAKSIQIKVSGNADEPDENDTTVPEQAALLRTTTGILSNRRPVAGTPATSGTTTPSDIDPRFRTPRLSLLATVKRESARKRLYAGFFKGPVLGPDVEAEVEDATAASDNTVVSQIDPTEPVSITQERQGKTKEKKKRRRDDSEAAVEEEKGKKKKHKKGDHNVLADNGPKQKKRKGSEDQHKGRKEKEREPDPHIPKEPAETAEEKRQRKAARAERRKRKEERRRAREERKQTAAKTSSLDDQ